MQVILQENVVNLGRVGDVVSVKNGFARNYLFPKSMALPVTVENKKILEEKRLELEKKAAKELAAAEKLANTMKDLSLSFTAESNEDGELFGSVSMNQVQELITAKGFAVEKKSLHVVEGVIKHVGDYTVIVQLHAEVKFEVKLKVEANLVNIVANNETGA